MVARVTAAAHESSNGRGRGGLGGVWNIIRAGTPFLADWTRNRPFLTGDFLFESKQSPEAAPATAAAKKAAAQLASFPIPIQESLVVDDVLSAMLGVEGQ